MEKRFLAIKLKKSYYTVVKMARVFTGLYVIMKPILTLYLNIYIKKGHYET